MTQSIEYGFKQIDDHPGIMAEDYNFVESASALDLSKENELLSKYESEEE